MTDQIDGLHHVTCITADPARNVAFYSGALGLRFVKRTVNFDAPRTWHLYFGDRLGRPGTAMTFFGWDLPQGRVGAGQVSLTQFAVPPGSLDFWTGRLPGQGATLLGREEVFGQPRAVFSDPDGLRIALVEAEDPREPWTTGDLGAEVAIRGFFGVTLALRDAAAAERVLGGIFGYGRGPAEGTLARWQAPGVAGVVDIDTDPDLPAGIEGAGTAHHVAYRVPDGAAQLAVREAMQAAGFNVTPQIDRTYFVAIYCRIPGGILFEVATEEPGFTVDEPAESLGSALKLPAQHEHLRAELERVLPPLEA